jgi:hypothetical protein
MKTTEQHSKQTKTMNANATTQLVKPAPISVERISMLIHEKGILPEIAAIDLEMVKMKMALADEGEGWTREQCEEAEVEYKRFLQLNLQNKKAAIVPTDVMDTMWHYHILDTRAYHRDSERVFGGYFHHFPYFGLRGDEDKQNLENSFRKTITIYEDTFGEAMLKGEMRDCWHDCQGRCWHACSNEDDYK